jgi:hypothetical protein
MQVGNFWLITIDTINGPWHVASLSDGRGAQMPRGINGEYMGRAGSWYIVNKDTGRSKRIGPVKSRGKNWCDEAKAEAKQRNIKLGFSQAYDKDGNLVDPDGMTVQDKAIYWEKEAGRLRSADTERRKELTKYLKDGARICPATWTHIVGAVRELILFRDCAKKAVKRRPVWSDPDKSLEGDSNYVHNNMAVCVEFLQLAERGYK